MITECRHTDTHTDYFLTCKLHWSGELQRPDGLVSTSDFSTGQLIKPFKNDRHNPNHFRLKHWWSMRRVNLYSLNTLKHRPGQTSEPILIYLNLKKPKNQKVHGKNTCTYMNIRLFIIHPIRRRVLQWNTKNQLKWSSRSWHIAIWRTLQSDWSIPFWTVTEELGVTWQCGFRLDEPSVGL